MLLRETSLSVYNFRVRPVIIVFAKAPCAGNVKTRLTPALTPADAARLHTAFVADTLLNLLDFSDADTELHTDIPTAAWSEFKVPRRLQHEGDLGLKMLQALRGALDEGHPQAMILGSDAPDLPASHLTQLLASPADVALGPCHDGGYYAIAARRVHADMFAGVEWSSSHEREQTVAACKAAGLTVECGPFWDDVDTPAQLPRLTGSSRAAGSAEVLRGLRICLE